MNATAPRKDAKHSSALHSSERKKRKETESMYTKPSQVSEKKRDQSAVKRKRKVGAGRSSKKKMPPLRVIPLGGLDGIGKNMTVYELGDDLIVDDAGIMFPDDEHPGIDLILPDYTYILENEHRLKAIIITHGHEDHTGALPYLLKDLNVSVPIYSSKLTLGLIKGKLEEHKIKKPDLREIKPGQTIKVGGFACTFFSVNHSIPDAMGVFYQTSQGNVLHTGDFKFDQTPVDNVFSDFAAITACGAKGVDLLLSDSTNAPRPGVTPSESEVGQTLDKIIAQARGRVFVATFSSHIHRLQQICDAARKSGRKVAVTGRSMLTNTKIARELGYLNVPDDLLVDSYDIKKLPESRLVVLCTGSQGEPLSALSRMANGEHRTLSIEAGDTVIISATPVPGNEKTVTNLINVMAKIGADVWDKSRALVHVSGHASSEELKLMLAMTKPTYFTPVHGEAIHLRAHARLATQVGVDPAHINILDNGDTLEISNGVVKLGKPVESGMVYVDGLKVGDTDQIVLRDRQRLSNDGIVTVVVSINERHFKVADIQFATRGVSLGENQDLFDEADQRLRKSLERSGRTKGRDQGAIVRVVRESLAGFLWDKLHTKPMIIPIILEV